MARHRLDSHDLQRLIHGWPRAQTLVARLPISARRSPSRPVVQTQMPRIDGGELEVELRDGATAHLRPVRTGDQDAILAFLRSMSPEPLYLRSHGIANIEKLATWATHTGTRDTYGIVATAGPARSVVAHAAYLRTSAQRAEAILAVADHLQGQGIGTMMLYALAWAARQHHITELVALISTSNSAMLDLIRTSGFQTTMTTDGPLTKVTMSTWPAADRVNGVS